MDILFPHKIIRIFSLILFSCHLVFSKNPMITLHFFLFFLLFFFFSKKFLSNANVVFRIAQPFKHQTCFFTYERFHLKNLKISEKIIGKLRHFFYCGRYMENSIQEKFLYIMLIFVSKLFSAFRILAQNETN